MWLSGRAFALHVKGPGFDPRHLQFLSHCHNVKHILPFSNLSVMARNGDKIGYTHTTMGVRQFGDHGLNSVISW